MSAKSQLLLNELALSDGAGNVFYLIPTPAGLQILTPSQAAQYFEIAPQVGAQPVSRLTVDPVFQDYISPIVTSLLAGGAFSIGSNGFTVTGGGAITQTSAKGATMVETVLEESVTLSTSGATTDTTANLLPANSIILGVTSYVSTTITTAASYTLGDAATAARFLASSTNITAGLSDVGLSAMFGVVSTTATGPTQASAAKLRVTCNTTPGAGVLTITVRALVFTPATS